MEFPVCKFAKTNSIKAQWQHVRSEAMEVQIAIVELREATGADTFCRACKVVEELADLRHSAETLARIIEREYPGIELDTAEVDVIQKNWDRGYYDEAD